LTTQENTIAPCETMNIRPVRSSGGNGKSSSSSSAAHIFITILLGCIFFYVGVMSGLQMGGANNGSKALGGCPDSSDMVGVGDVTLSEEEKMEVEEMVKTLLGEEFAKMDGSDISKMDESDSSPPEALRFPSTMSSFIAGSALIEKDEFTSLLDLGVPVDKGKGTGKADVLMLYNTERSLPYSYKSVVASDGGLTTPSIPAKDALENCESLHVVLTQNPGTTQQCMAIMNHYESYQIARYMRSGNPPSVLIPSEKFRSISRGHMKTGRDNLSPPTAKDILSNFKDLSNYFKHFEDVTAELKPILKRVADDKGTVIVQTCNKGQSELLMNFACSARTRGLEDVLKHVLVFATDLETKELAEGLGLNTFFDEKNLGKMPKTEARAYGDRAFTMMMYAKVVCVQLVNFLGYNLLFQDVDIVWYQNPLTYFYDTDKSGDFDIYFQDDGAHSVRYAPYSANSGFYYVRHNDRTQYLFTTLLYNGDMIKAWDSHQQALVAILTDHASYYGLKVKVLGRDENEFPGGFHYHRRRDYMKKLVKGKEDDAYIFHMSWTHNKDNKLKFFKQMGEWYLNEKCVGKTLGEITEGGAVVTELPLVEPCCLAEPEITCYYSDKPSKTTCNGSPTIDKGGKPFW